MIKIKIFSKMNLNNKITNNNNKNNKKIQKVFRIFQNYLLFNRNKLKIITKNCLSKLINCRIRK